MPRYIDTFVCDDVRRELGNKLSIMGLYGLSIGVPSFPWHASVLWIVQRWTDLPEPTTVRFQITLPGIHEPLIQSMEMVEPTPALNVRNLLMKLEAVQVPERGEMTVETYFGESSEPSHSHIIMIVLGEELP